MQRRSHSYVQNSVSKFSSIKSSENKRLSAVISKYIKPNIAKQTWQMDSSSWEFLNQTNNSRDDSAEKDSAEKCKQNSTSSQDSEKSKHVDSGLDSTLSFTNKGSATYYVNTFMEVFDPPCPHSSYEVHNYISL